MQWIGTLLGFTGAIIIIFSDLKEGLSLIAFFAGLIGLISSSIGMIWQKKLALIYHFQAIILFKP
jgi:drug/metabolite transporter (DMT)-like permease